MTNPHAGSATAPYNAFADPAYEAAAEALPTVPTRPRANGWTPARQHRFLDALATHGCVATACRELGLSPQSAYLLRARPGAEAFREAWDASIAMALDRVEQTALARALEGWQDPICYGGQVIAHRQRHDTRLILKLLERTDRLREAARTRAETRAATLASQARAQAQAPARAITLATAASPPPAPPPQPARHEDVLALPHDSGDRLARALTALGHPDCVSQTASAHAPEPASRAGSSMAQPSSSSSSAAPHPCGLATPEPARLTPVKWQQGAAADSGRGVESFPPRRAPQPAASEGSPCLPTSQTLQPASRASTTLSAAASPAAASSSLKAAPAPARPPSPPSS